MAGRVAGAVLAAAAVVAFATGCNKSGQETAAPRTTDASTAESALWDPCSQISSDILQKLGADPSTRDVGISGVQQSGWKDCGWEYLPDHSRSITVWSTIHTIEDFKKKSDNTNFASITVQGRSGWRFHRVSDKNNETCDLVFSASTGGSYQISYYNLDPGMTSPPCDGAMSAANIIVPILPK